MNARLYKILFLLAAVQFTVIVDFMVVMPLGPQLIRAFAIDTSRFSWIVSSYSLAGGISAIFASYFLDLFDRKKSFLILYIGFLLGTYLCAESKTAEQLMLMRAFTGFFGGLMGAQVFAISGDLIPNEFRGRSTGVIMAAFSAAAVFGVPMGLYLAQQGDWHSPFRYIVYVGLFILLLGWWVLPKMVDHIEKREGRDPWEIYKYILRHKKLRIGLALYPCLMFAHFSIIPFISPYLVFNVGFPEKDLFLVYMLGGGVTIFSSQIIGKWVDRTTPYNVFKQMAIYAVIPILILTHLGHVNNYIVLSVTTAFFIMGSARFIPAISALTNLIEPRYRGGYMSLNSALQQMGSGLAAQLAGYLTITQADGTLKGYDHVGYVAFGATFLAIYTFRKIDKHSQKAAPVVAAPITSTPIQ